MMILEVSDEVAAPLADHAARRNVTPEALALDHLRALVSSPSTGSLLEFLGARVGAVTGTGEAFSEDTGRRLADGLAAARAARP